MIKVATQILLVHLAAFAGCTSAEEAPRVRLEVIVDASAIGDFTTDLGYDVSIAEAQMIVEDISFVAKPQAQASLLDKVEHFLLPPAHAHPGHGDGGDITGELLGRFIVDWTNNNGATVGIADLVVGDYRYVNFGLARGKASDGMEPSDKLFDHTAYIAGTVRKAGDNIAFSATIDSPLDRQLTGAIFNYTAAVTSQDTLGLRLLTTDELGSSTLLDKIDFALLDTDGDGSIVIDANGQEQDAIDAYNLLRTSFQTHDYFRVQTTN